MNFTFRLSLVLLLAAALRAEEPMTTEPVPEEMPSLEELYESGRVLFELFAPDEIKEHYEFPSKDQWDGFAVRLQGALEGDSLEELVFYEPEARAALAALRAFPGYEDYADWLAERLDYIEAAKTVQAAPPPPVETVRPVRPIVPHYNLWLERIRARPVPVNAARHVATLGPIFAAEGVPAQLVWLAEVESTFNPNARSPVGARGLFQFMPATAQEMGLSTFFPDERTHPEKSARAAARYLRQLHTRFGDWPLALAAYNAGPGRVQRTLAKSDQKTFTAISAALPVETRMYVPKVLATMVVRAGWSPDKL
jgi:membrane-bound lytic murein transglycosylase D